MRFEQNGKPWKTKNFLHNLYVIKQWRVQEIAKFTGADPYEISFWIIKHKLAGET